MPVLDFCEIPEAHIASGRQDEFEHFAEDSLISMGYEVIERPGRGADQGKDLIVSEVRKGIGRETRVRWLVSCKHKALSGRSVGVDDESNIFERVKQHRCDGFLGFYSTISSSSLLERLKSLSDFETQVLDRSAIERHLLASEKGRVVCRKYFPKSYREWTIENPTPANVFSDQARILTCNRCGRDLLDPPQGIYALWIEGEDEKSKIVDVYWACKGKCDDTLLSKIREKNRDNGTDFWEDISDLAIPIIYLKYLLARITRIRVGEQWSDEAFGKYKELMIAVFPYVAREASSVEAVRVEQLIDLRSSI